MQSAFYISVWNQSLDIYQSLNQEWIAVYNLHRCNLSDSILLTCLEPQGLEAVRVEKVKGSSNSKHNILVMPLIQTQKYYISYRAAKNTEQFDLNAGDNNILLTSVCVLISWSTVNFHNKVGILVGPLFNIHIFIY